MAEVRDEAAEQEPSTRTRIAVGAGVLLAVVLVGGLLFSAGSGYTVTATFESASQLVKGNQVRLGGVPVGTVTGIELGSHGQARVTMEIGNAAAPLDTGTRAIIRQTSLSGIANRYVDLRLPRGADGRQIADGGEVPADDAVASVELDSVFDTLDERTRGALREFFQGSAAMFDGRGAQARAGFRYLNPALASSRRLLQEAAGDTVVLERFVLDSAKLVTAVAQRRDDLAALVGNLGATTRAAGADQAALAGALEGLPGFMRRANTTFVNLRATLDDVDPLVNAAKPAAADLRRFLPELRGLARDGRPTVRDLSRTIRNRGADNDLVELLKTFPPLADVAVEAKQRNGQERPGSFPQTRQALERATPIVAFGRPYTPDLFGWFDDFSHTGSYDALGGFSRTQVYLNLASADVGTATPQLLDLQERAAEFLRVARTEQYKRCPGHAEVAAPDGSNVYSQAELQSFDCNPADRASGAAVGG